MAQAQAALLTMIAEYPDVMTLVIATIIAVIGINIIFNYYRRSKR